jgi:TonB family protein
MSTGHFALRAFLLPLGIAASSAAVRPVAPLSEVVPELTILPDSHGVPVYPPMLYAANVEGEVTLALAVHGDGRVDTARTTVVRSAHALFTHAVRAALPHWRVSGAAASPDSLSFVTITFELPRQPGIAILVRLDAGRHYLVIERPLYGPSRELSTEPLADTLRAAVLAAGFGPDVEAVRFYPEDQAARALYLEKPVPDAAGGGETQYGGECLIARRAGSWMARCSQNRVSRVLY